MQLENLRIAAAVPHQVLWDDNDIEAAAVESGLASKGPLDLGILNYDAPSAL